MQVTVWLQPVDNSITSLHCLSVDFRCFSQVDLSPVRDDCAPLRRQPFIHRYVHIFFDCRLVQQHN